MNTSNTNIGIIDDHAIFRRTIASYLSANTPFKVVLQASSGKEFISKFMQTSPEDLPSIVMTDVNMSGIDRFETASWLRKNKPTIKVMILTLNRTEAVIIRMITLGAVAYLHKSIHAQELSDAIATVAKEGFYYNDYIPREKLHLVQPQTLSIWNSLSDLERVITMRLSTDLTYLEIATSMNLSFPQFETLRKALFKKFYLTSRISLIALLVRENLIP